MQMFPLPKMRMMRKYAGKATAAAMAAAMMVSMMGVTAFAENKTSDSTTVNYTVEEAYTWSVPSEVTFTAGEGGNVVTADGEDTNPQKVKVENNVIANTKKLQIALGSNQTFKIISKEGAALSYKVTKNSSDLRSDSVVLEVVAGTNTGEQALTFTLTKDEVEKAGTYTGTLSYTASVVDGQ